ncbi:MAG: PIG-L family deacetylase [Planctomycetes bacterium]|nr:PIG-L family deacetylase [Planctomycetota bacterium]
MKIAQIERILVFGAHPDDEIIGAGGFVHRLSREGGEAHVVTFTCGETAADSVAGMAQMARRREKEMTSADRALGVTSRRVLSIPSQQVYDAVYGDSELHHELIRIIREAQPDAVLAHAPDNHRDHCAVARIAPQSVFQAAERILGALGEPWQTRLLLRYGVQQEVEEPNLVVRIGREDLEAKLKALRTQLSQRREGYLERFEQMIRARAELWGARRFGAGEYAEAFHLDASRPLLLP